MKVVIVGAGIMGMMLARELALAGVNVTLVDKGQPGQEASWAGGGIISPLYPWRYSDAVTQLASWSQQYYPNLVESLEAESGIDPELSHHGMLMLSVHDREAALAWHQRHGHWMETVDAAFIYQREPALREGFESALYMPRVASVRNPRLLQALKRSLSSFSRVTFVSEQPVTGFVVEQGRVQGVITGRDRIMADRVVLCSGAWSGQLLASLGLNLPVEPVKGQMLLFKSNKPVCSGVVLHDGRYLIPRRDGHVLVGSTLEYAGFDKTTTQDARDDLFNAAVGMMPGLKHLPLVQQWSGLRPGSPGGVPFIGPVPGVEGLFVNAGQFRNGLVLAPASVKALLAQLLDQPPPFDIAPYQLPG